MVQRNWLFILEKDKLKTNSKLIQFPVYLHVKFTLFYKFSRKITICFIFTIGTC